MDEFTENEIMSKGSEDFSESKNDDCTREEYDLLMSGVFRKFYEQDVMDLKKEIADAAQTDETYSELSGDEWEKIKGVYPECIPETEMANKLFAHLVDLLKKQGDFDPIKAYEMVHIEEIKKISEHAGEISAEKNLVKRLRSRGLRPDENGISKVGALIKRNVAGMTRSERASLAARAARGEHIKL